MSQVQWGDVPTWVAAIATVAAAVGAFVAARIAFNQLKEQRAEIRRQSAEQGRMAQLQGEQLKQLEQQAELTTRQIARLDQQTEALRRSQAERVAVQSQGVDTQFSGINPDEFTTVIVTNNSNRPIRNLRCSLMAGGARYGSKMARPDQPVAGEAADRQGEVQHEPIMFLRAGAAIWFLFTRLYDNGRDGFLLRFDDDAGNRWELDQNLHLGEQPDTTW